MIFPYYEVQENLNSLRKMEAFEKRKRLFWLSDDLIKQMIEESDPYYDCTGWMKYELINREVALNNVIKYSEVK